MNRLYRNATRAALSAVALGMIGLAALGVAMQKANDSAAEGLAQDTLVWSAMRLELDNERLISRLAALAAEDGAVVDLDAVGQGGEEGVDHRAAMLELAGRLRRLSARVAFLSSGDVGDSLMRLDGAHGAVERLSADLQAASAAIAAIDPGPGAPAEIAALIDIFDENRQRLRELTIASSRFDAQRRAMVREELSAGRDRAAAVTFGAIVFAALLAVFGLAEARRFRLLARQNAASARAAKAANEAKSRFLTMMSHELRTPMNGVLGLIALSRRDAASPEQDALLDQAEKSGSRMMSLIGDIIDYTAVDGRPPDAVRRPFAPAQMAADLVRKLQEPAADDIPHRFGAEVSARTPRECVGAIDYLHRALEHLCAYMLETAGVQDMRVMIDHAEDELRVEISFNYLLEAEGRWRPERILGDDPADTEKAGVTADDPAAARAADRQVFAADPLGPTIARGFIAAIGGRIEMNSLYRGRTAVTVFAPVTASQRSAPVVALAVGSATMRLICASALRGAGAEIIEAGERGQAVTAVLVECGASDEGAHHAAGLRRAHPEARLVALGAPHRPELYDAVATLPLEVNRLSEALFGREDGDADGREHLAPPAPRVDVA